MTSRPNTKKRQKLRCKLRERDGDNCFYCGKPMMFFIEQGPNAASLEHLIEIAQGGNNKQKNLVLAHIRCNSSLCGMTINNKLKIRQKMLRKIMEEKL